jgi:3-methyladenine DNA glycosylase AlkC
VIFSLDWFTLRFYFWIGSDMNIPIHESWHRQKYEDYEYNNFKNPKKRKSHHYKNRKKINMKKKNLTKETFSFLTERNVFFMKWKTQHKITRIIVKFKISTRIKMLSLIISALLQIQKGQNKTWNYIRMILCLQICNFFLFLVIN